MTVGDLVDKLVKYDRKVDIVVSRKNDDGCGTCGYGATSSDIDISDVTDLETRVVLTLDE